MPRVRNLEFSREISPKESQAGKKLYPESIDSSLLQCGLVASALHHNPNTHVQANRKHTMLTTASVMVESLLSLWSSLVG